MSTQKEFPFKWSMEDNNSIYQARQYLTDQVKKDLRLLIPVDVYIQDPLISEQARALDDSRIAGRSEWKPVSTIYVPCEPDIMQGPTSARLAVVDYNADTNRLEEPAQWDAKNKNFYVKQGREKIPLTKENSDLPQFHQVNVWAIVQSILNMYEQTWILGRSAPWAFEGNRLTLVPHAGEMRNAFYDRSSKSMQFYYFQSGSRRVETCLSHDIIAHETGHAILDGLRPLYLVDSSLETAAFHETMADATAIISSLLNNELRFKTLQETGGDLESDQVISALAEEFGYYSYGRPYLRSAQNKLKMADVQDKHSPYDWSEVLTGAIFDILKAIFAIRKTTPLENGKTPTLRAALVYAVNRFRRVIFQPLDYLPPVDVQFTDFAQAVLRADELLEPEDEKGYRAAMQQAFEARGIDCTPQDPVDKLNFYAYDINRLSKSRTDAYHFLNENRRQLCIPLYQDISINNLYQTEKTTRDGERLPREIVVQYTWHEDVALKGKEFGTLDGEYTSLMCGGTLVFDSQGNVRSWQHKPGMGKQETGQRLRKHCKEEFDKGRLRRDQLLAYLKDRIAAGVVGLDGFIRPDEIGERMPIIPSRQADGNLKFETVPYLRHWNEA